MKPFIRPDRNATKPHSSPFVWVRERDECSLATRYTLYRYHEDGRMYGLALEVLDEAAFKSSLGARAFTAHSLRKAREHLKHTGSVLPTPWKSVYENT